MREILFKGKRVDNGGWVEGSCIITEKEAYIVFGVETMPIDSECCDLYATEWYQVDPETVGQYTGLKDKNGVKIFENDIIRDCNEDNEVFTVKYYAHRRYPAFDCEPEMHCDCNGLSYLMETGELAVIGNIFDNPELLEVQHE